MVGRGLALACQRLAIGLSRASNCLAGARNCLIGARFCLAGARNCFAENSNCLDGATNGWAGAGNCLGIVKVWNCHQKQLFGRVGFNWVWEGVGEFVRFWEVLGMVKVWNCHHKQLFCKKVMPLIKFGCAESHTPVSKSSPPLGEYRRF